MRAWILVAVVVVAACGGDDSSGGGGAPTCEAAVARRMQQQCRGDLQSLYAVECMAMENDCADGGAAYKSCLYSATLCASRCGCLGPR